MDIIYLKDMYKSIARELMANGNEPYEIINYLVSHQHADHRTAIRFSTENGSVNYSQLIINDLLSTNAKAKASKQMFGEPLTADTFISNGLKKSISSILSRKGGPHVDEDHATDAYDKKYLGLLKNVFGKKPAISEMNNLVRSQLIELTLILARVDSDYSRPQIPSYLDWPSDYKKASVEYQAIHHPNHLSLKKSSKVNFLALFDELKSHVTLLMDKINIQTLSDCLIKTDNVADVLFRKLKKELEQNKHHDINAKITSIENYASEKLKQKKSYLDFKHDDCNLLNSFYVYLEILCREHYALGQKRLFDQSYTPIPDESKRFIPFLKDILYNGVYSGPTFFEACQKVDHSINKEKLRSLIVDGEKFLKFYNQRLPQENSRPIQQSRCFECIASIMILFEKKHSVTLNTKLPKYSKNDTYSANTILTKYILRESNPREYPETAGVYWEQRFEYYVNSLIGNVDLVTFKLTRQLQASVSSCINILVRSNLLIDVEKLDIDITELVSYLE